MGGDDRGIRIVIRGATVTDRQPDEPPGSPPLPEPGGEPVAEPAAVPGQNVQRRAFLRQLTGEAVVTTARLAGLSSVVRRSLVAAGEAAARDLDPADEGAPPAAPGPTSTTPVQASTVAAGAPLARSGPPSESAVAVTLTARQEEILTLGDTAVLGINDPSGAPHLTSSIYHWDGTIIRLPSELLAARAARVDADPRVSVLVTEASSEAWVAMTGLASVVAGDDVQKDTLTILRKYMPADEAERLWAEVRSSGDRVVIQVRPTRFVWRLE